MKTLILLFPVIILISSCNGVSDRTKEAINKGGETVGKTATEFIEGVTKGVDKTLQCTIDFSPSLKDKGLQTGKFSIENGPNGGNNNCFRLYLIFEKDFKGTLMVKAKDKDGLEFGRTRLDIDNKAGSASYFDFVFDSRSSIEVKSVIQIE